MSARRIVVFGAMMCVSALLARSATGAIGDATAVDNYTVGFYTLAQMEEFGTPVEYIVADGGSYANLSSKVIAVIGGSHLDPPEEERIYRGTAPQNPPYNPPASPYLGTEVTIRAGTNTSGSATTVRMAWRTRVEIEVDTRGYPTDGYQMPPAAFDSYGMGSDIVEITGMVGPYVMESEYHESSLIYTNEGYSEELFAEDDWLYLGWLEDEAHKSGGALPDQIEWVHATEGNSGVGTVAVIENYQGSYDDFVGEYTDFTAEGYLGSYGVDIVSNTVWGVLDHNSQFSAVPEPATLGLLALAGLALISRRKR